jgi:hypothetical protein
MEEAGFLWGLFKMRREPKDSTKSSNPRGLRIRSCKDRRE